MSLDDFMVSTALNVYEQERKNRIKLSLAAYAYEFKNTSIISDAEFDKLALAINTEVSTIEEYHTDLVQIERYKLLDNFFKTEFQPDTGQWIHKHPELDRLEALYHKLWRA